MTTCTLFAALLVAAPGLKPKPGPDDVVPAGEWIAERLEYMGTDFLKSAGSLVFTFRDRTVLVRLEKLELTFGVTFDPTAKVKEINVTPDMSGDGHLVGIYKIEGDALTICLADKVGSPRPREFKADGPDVGLIILKKAR